MGYRLSSQVVTRGHVRGHANEISFLLEILYLRLEFGRQKWRFPQIYRSRSDDHKSILFIKFRLYPDSDSATAKYPVVYVGLCRFLRITECMIWNMKAKSCFKYRPYFQIFF